MIVNPWVLFGIFGIMKGKLIKALIYRNNLSIGHFLFYRIPEGFKCFSSLWKMRYHFTKHICI